MFKTEPFPLTQTQKSVVLKQSRKSTHKRVTLTKKKNINKKYNEKMQHTNRKQKHKKKINAKNTQESCAKN